MVFKHFHIEPSYCWKLHPCFWALVGTEGLTKEKKIQFPDLTSHLILSKPNTHEVVKCQENSIMIYTVRVLATQLYPTLCDPMDCSLPDFFVHRILQWEYWSG